MLLLGPRIRVTVLLVTSTCLSASAQVAPGSVQGTVVVGDTGKPASGITLWLEPADQQAAPKIDPQTGEYDIHDTDGHAQRLPATLSPDGSFVIPNVSPGSYIVHTFAPPYLPTDGTVYPTSNEAHVATGPQASPDSLRVQVKAGQASSVAVRLRLGGAIEGTVSMGDGSPAVSDVKPPFGVSVSAERKLGPNSYAREGGAAHTDGRGHYRLDGLAPGDYILFAATPGPMVQTATGMAGTGGLPVYAPGTVRPSAATVVHIAGTETAHAELVLPPATALHRIEGSVVVNGEAALRTALLRLYPKGEGGLTASTRLQPNANFSFDNVPDGEYTLSVEFPRQSELVSIDRERGIVHMRQLPVAYATTTQDVRVAGQNIAGVLVQPAQAQPSAGSR